ncbi:MAG: hypothetical protein K6E75_10455, partial [Lachnospiraceae bacterium]|nr:hypothetical protein [Lachnospiraceae bacterium]
MKKIFSDDHNPFWYILILLFAIYLMLLSWQIRAKADEIDGFLPGGAWELDTGKEIKADDFFEGLDRAESGEETISAEGQGIDDDAVEASYDPRDMGLVSEVRDQGRFALCWDYAAVSTAESALIKSGYDKCIDLSEYHGVAITYLRQQAAGLIPESMSFEAFCNEGGNPAYIWSLWLEGYGPGLEEDYPAVNTISENSVPKEIRQGRISSLSTVRKLEGGINEIKREIKQNG